MTDPRTLFSPERDFYRSVSRNAKSTGLNRSLFRGLVTFVDRSGSPQRPRFSIQAKIIGIERLGNNDLITRGDNREHRSHHCLRRTAGNRDLSIRIKTHPVVSYEKLFAPGKAAF